MIFCLAGIRVVRVSQNGPYNTASPPRWVHQKSEVVGKKAGHLKASINKVRKSMFAHSDSSDDDDIDVQEAEIKSAGGAAY